MRLSRATNFFTQDRLQTRFFILPDDLLNSALRHFNVPRDLFRAYMLAILTKDKADPRPVQFHIPDFTSKLRWDSQLVQYIFK